MAELLGKTAGPNRGKGGRGHLAKPDQGFFGAHAVVGGNLSIAAGVALAAMLEGRGDVVACVFGDGACGAGALHETLNIAALWNLPLLLVCDNNELSVSTPRATQSLIRALTQSRHSTTVARAKSILMRRTSTGSVTGSMTLHFEQPRYHCPLLSIAPTHETPPHVEHVKPSPEPERGR